MVASNGNMLKHQISKSKRNRNKRKKTILDPSGDAVNEASNSKGKKLKKKKGSSNSQMLLTGTEKNVKKPNYEKPKTIFSNDQSSKMCPDKLLKCDHLIKNILHPKIVHEKQKRNITLAKSGNCSETVKLKTLSSEKQVQHSLDIIAISDDEVESLDITLAGKINQPISGQVFPSSSNSSKRKTKKRKRKAEILSLDSEKNENKYSPMKETQLIGQNHKKKVKKCDLDPKGIENEQSSSEDSNLRIQKQKKKKVKKSASDVKENDHSSLEDCNPSIQKQKKKKVIDVGKKEHAHSSSEKFHLNAIKQKKIKKRSLDSEGNNNEYSSLEDACNRELKQKKQKSESLSFKSQLKKNENSSPDDSEDDSNLRDELLNCKVYNKIQKLMLHAPFLNPNYQGASDDIEVESIDSNFDVESEISGEDFSIDSPDESIPESTTKCKEPKKGVRKINSSEATDLNVKSKGVKQKIGMNLNTPPLLSSDLKLQYLESSFKSNNCDGTGNMTRSIGQFSEKEKASNALRNRALEKLRAAKFRYLNEKLYTETGQSAFKFFQNNQSEYDDYHEGYRAQVSKWPMNPVNRIISELHKLKNKVSIADMGCGDAKIAQTLSHNTVHSFDLVAVNEFVTACDISRVPLQNQCVDIVVFCLSLMGTNVKDYLVEAHRILQMGGALKIAEVQSRVEDVNSFIKSIESIGFSLQSKDVKHKLFVFLDFNKDKKKPKNAKLATISLRPCLYKKR